MILTIIAVSYVFFIFVVWSCFAINHDEADE